jgi:hypothetical protein
MGTVGRVERPMLEQVARIAGPLLGWDGARCDREVAVEVARRRASDFSRTV